MKLEFIKVCNGAESKMLIDLIYEQLDNRKHIFKDVFVAKAVELGATEAEATDYFDRNAFKPSQLRG